MDFAGIGASSDSVRAPDDGRITDDELKAAAGNASDAGALAVDVDSVDRGALGDPGHVQNVGRAGNPDQDGPGARGCGRAGAVFDAGQSDQPVAVVDRNVANRIGLGGIDPADRVAGQALIECRGVVGDAVADRAVVRDAGAWRCGQGERGRDDIDIQRNEQFTCEQHQNSPFLQVGVVKRWGFLDVIRHPEVRSNRLRRLRSLNKPQVG